MLLIGRKASEDPASRVQWPPPARTARTKQRTPVCGMGCVAVWHVPAQAGLGGAKGRARTCLSDPPRWRCSRCY